MLRNQVVCDGEKEEKMYREYEKTESMRWCLDVLEVRMKRRSAEIRTVIFRVAKEQSKEAQS